ncbi:MAG: hypothetical protein WD738_20805 [Pirellulales bacterium]
MDFRTRDRWLAVNYAATIFISAFLLFQIQPLISKYILPWFGGSAAVWTTCLLFFQTLLFAGYAYAHAANTWLTPRRQAAVHLALILAAVAMLGVLPGDQWQPRSYHDPVRQILIILAVSVGLPYFVLSATGPLLQAWFARSFPGRMPYRLYALSNLGSLIALVSYPFVFERAFDLPRQALLWSAGFLLFALCCAYGAWRLWTSSSLSPTRGRESAAADSPTWATPRWFHRLAWLLWPAFGSVVLLATTNRVTTDIAAIPFLWIVPLALYLVTFIIAFDRPAWYRSTLVAALMLVAIYAAAVVHRLGVGYKDVVDAGTPGLVYSLFLAPTEKSPEVHISTTEFLVVNFTAMFAICMLCHGELVRQRPDPRYLTSYYLLIAAGGALGGAFVILVAPQIFKTFYEWELSLLVGCVLAIGFILRALVNFIFGSEDKPSRKPAQYLLLAGVVLAVFLPSAVILLDLSEYLQPPIGQAKLRTRNFFGTLAVLDRGDTPLTHMFFLKHGAITHGAQYTHETRRREPTTYYGRTSGAARTIDYFRQQLTSGRMNLGVVGLGTGTLAAYADKGDAVTFYEINPAVIEIAESGRWFTFLKDCRSRDAQCEVHLGDARLTLERELHPASERPVSSPPHVDGEGSGAASPQQYHILALDAFSGDAVPIHLLTVEAFELYLAHLSTPTDGAPGETASPLHQHGAIAVHISNRYLNLEPVVRGIARHFGLFAIYIEDEDDDKHAVYSSDWMILTRNERLADELSHFAEEQAPYAPTILWTDNHSSLFDILK